MEHLYFVFSISLIGLFMLIINAVLFLYKSKNKDSLYKTILVYLVIMSLIESVCNYIGFFIPGNNLFISHFQYNIQFLILSVFFYKLFHTPFLKKLVVFNCIAIWSFLGYQYFLTPEIFWICYLPEILSISFILIIYALIHLYNSLGEVKSYYYFSIGLLMYLLCSSIIFMAGNVVLVFCEDPFIDIWIFNSLLYIVFQALIFKEWKLLTNKQS